MEDAQSIKALILAVNSEITTEKFKALVVTEDLFSKEELKDLYKEFKFFKHGGKFNAYAEIISKHDPSVETFRPPPVQQSSKGSIHSFLSKGSPRKDKRGPEEESKPEAQKEDADKTQLKKGKITDFMGKK